MRLLFIAVHLVGAMAGVFVTAVLTTVPGRWKWPVMAGAIACALLNAGAAVVMLM